jgi:hypothetical protein
MRKILLITGLLITLYSVAQQKISIEDFKPLQGKWKGTLTYLDYKDNKETTIPANTLIEIAGNEAFNQYVFYSAEPDKNARTKYEIKNKGMMLNDRKITGRTHLPDGSLQLTMESTGTDGNDNKAAAFQHILIISSSAFSVTKMVKFNEEEGYFRRHIYSFRR